MKMRFTFVFLLIFTLSGCMGLIVAGTSKVYTEPTYSTYMDYTDTEVLKHYGEPDFVLHKSGCEIWGYHDDVGLSGILIGLYAPIPLVFPSGWLDTLYYFKDGKSILKTNEKVKMLYCKFSFMGESGGPCSVKHWEGENQMPECPAQ